MSNTNTGSGFQLSKNENRLSGVQESYFECPICLNTLLRPVTLVCGHNFCGDCLKNEDFSHLKQQCPVCRKFILINLKLLKVNLVLDHIISEYYRDSLEYQERRSAYYERAKFRKSQRFSQRLMEKLNKKFIVIATYFRKCVPFITLGFAILLLYLVKYHLNKLDIRKLEASYTSQLNKIFSLIKSNVSADGSHSRQSVGESSNQHTLSSDTKQQNSAVDLQNLIFSKLIKYLFTNYIRLSLPGSA